MRHVACSLSCIGKSKNKTIRIHNSKHVKEIEEPVIQKVPRLFMIDSFTARAVSRITIRSERLQS